MVSFFNIGCSLITQDQSPGEVPVVVKAIVLNVSFDGLKLCLPTEKFSRQDILNLSKSKYNLLCHIRLPGSLAEYEIPAKLKWHRLKRILNHDLLLTGLEFLPKSPEFTLALNVFIKQLPKGDPLLSKDKRFHQRVPVQGAMAELHLNKNWGLKMLSPGKIAARIENVSASGSKVVIEGSFNQITFKEWQRMPVFKVKLFIPGIPDLYSWGARLIHVKPVSTAGTNGRQWILGLKWIKASDKEINELMESLVCQWHLIQTQKV